MEPLLWMVSCCGQRFYEGYDEDLARRLWTHLRSIHMNARLFSGTVNWQEEQ